MCAREWGTIFHAGVARSPYVRVNVPTCAGTVRANLRPHSWKFVPGLTCAGQFALRARVKVPVLRPGLEHLFAFVPGGLPYGCINTPARARDNAPDAAKLGLTNDFEVC